MKKDLPYFTDAKKVWPWVAEKRTLPSRMSDGSPWPKISIVTPSFNQGRYIEETIRSVLLQGYPNLEYIIVDGGSTDNTVEIIKKYSDELSYWFSEPDKGQSEALNKGFARATGELFAYINSDDFYTRDAFAAVAEAYVRSGRPGLLAGICETFNQSGYTGDFFPRWPDDLSHFLHPFGSTFAQPAAFWTRQVHYEAGGFDTFLHYALDREFFLRIGLLGIRPLLMKHKIACYRDHKKVKTRNTIKFYEESISIVQKYGRRCGLSDKEIKKKVRKNRNEHAYLKSFMIWKWKGRRAAVSHFIQTALKSPIFILDRKVLGLARRLFMFREMKVKELEGFPDYRRWRNAKVFDPEWDSRTRIIATLVAPGSSVIEFGAGRMALKNFLPANCSYTPSDLFSRGPETIVCDLNSDKLPPFPPHDVAVFGGVLEYIHNVPRLISHLSTTVKVIIASYAVAENNKDFYEHGWVNRFTSSQLLGIFEASGFYCDHKEPWRDQMVFRFVKKDYKQNLFYFR